MVIVEGRAEKLMWLLMANVNRTGGARVVANTAVLQAACVDSTVVPFLEKRINFSFGCYGYREATDIEPGETVLGFKGELLPVLAGEIERLAGRAIPWSRAKRPNAALAGKGEGSAGPFGGDPS